MKWFSLRACGIGATVSKGMADHAGRSRRLASSVQHHPLRAVACDWPALLVCLAAPCMSRIPRGAKGEDHDYRQHHSGFDHYRCHLSHAPAQRRRLRLGRRRPVASAKAACIGSAKALVVLVANAIICVLIMFLCWYILGIFNSGHHAIQAKASSSVFTRRTVNRTGHPWPADRWDFGRPISDSSGRVANHFE